VLYLDAAEPEKTPDGLSIVLCKTNMWIKTAALIHTLDSINGLF